MSRDSDIDYTRTSDLTIEEVKAVPVFEHFTDQEAEEVIATIKILTKIAFDCYKKVSENEENMRPFS